MYIVKDVNNVYSSSVIAEVDSLPEAIRAIPGKIYLIEEDEQFPGHHDVITWQCRQFAIEPKKAKKNV